ncbi:biliverdin-producing heme oxygenase [Emticicia sp. BO119]|uniref:biliverdin-producing heme oxygenase n=1 Tax=Emticicia sp. BO119 TaxID=2757768 RepID=UPI0015F0C4F6|nr:biliverdin-producing heme oxygenase [Emticicia sp. BO119]MBA4853849.1 biliverdin-producing heme oxygenase [Emticicia sp. BO119]
MNQTDNILAQLRTHTSLLHSALEQTPLSAGLLDEGVSQKNYVTYLQKMREIVAFYEAEIFPVLDDTLPDLTKREKLSLIDKDLHYLSVDRSGLPGFENSTGGNSSIGYAMGCMYVMEGSTLGGKVILKHISKTLGIVPEQGGSYLDGYGDQTGQFWKIFLNILQEYSANNDCDNEIIAGAKDTFTSIKLYFEQ